MSSARNAAAQRPSSKHFRCVPRNPVTNEYDDQASARCEYVVPAKRANVLPDGVELVFVDDTRELKNPAFPIWLTLWTQANPMFLEGLCNKPAGTMAGEKKLRAFTFFPAFGDPNNGKQWFEPVTYVPCSKNADCSSNICRFPPNGVCEFPWP